VETVAVAEISMVRTLLAIQTVETQPRLVLVAEVEAVAVKQGTIVKICKITSMAVAILLFQVLVEMEG
jgi:hypothetical protein